MGILKIFIFLVAYFSCLNLGFSQTSVPTPTPTVVPPASNTVISPPATPASNPLDNTPGSVSGPAAGSTGRPADTLLNVLGSINTPKGGLYQEHQSLCRENLYDTPAFLDSDAQTKRINELKEKINTGKSILTEKIALLKEYADQGKKTEAEKLYIEIKTEKSSTALNSIAESIYFLSRGDLIRAESILSKLAIDDNKNVLALTYLAEIYLKNRKYFETAAAYYDLVKLTKTSFDFQLCEVHILESQHKDAEKFCLKANQQSESNPYPLIYLGISQREKQNYEVAIKYFKDSLRKKQTEMGFSCLAEIYYIKEKFSSAASLYQRALKITPYSSRALLGLAWAQFKDKKYTESLDSFKRSCRLNRNVATELRQAYKILTDEKSEYARVFGDQVQLCID